MFDRGVVDIIVCRVVVAGYVDVTVDVVVDDATTGDSDTDCVVIITIVGVVVVY